LPHKVLFLLLLLLLYNIPSSCECSASLLSLVGEHFNAKCSEEYFEAKDRRDCSK
jgi:hypothetical protein